HRISPLDDVAGHVAGVVIGLGGAALVFLAQVQMGASWRIGLDPEERTDLVTAGLFGVVRNPIYAGMLATIVGIALLVPNVVALVRSDAWTGLLLLTGAATVMATVPAAVVALGPRMERSLHAGDGGLLAVVVAAAMAGLASGPFLGVLADRRGRTRVSAAALA